MSRIYERFCKRINSYLGPTEEEIEERRKEKKEDFIDKSKKLKEAERNLKQTKILYGEGSKQFKKSVKRLNKVEQKFDKAKRNYKRESFEETMYFTNMDLDYEEVLVFSLFTTIISFFAILSFFVIYYQFNTFSLLETITYVVPSLTVIPSLVLYITANYPDIIEKKLKAESIGKAPQSINYMTMSMRVRPSLYKAVSFAAKNAEEPIASGLNRVLWKVHTREKTSLEDAVLSFAREWGKWNEHLKRALYTIRSSLLEKSRERMNSALQKANDIVIEGTKREVKDFADSLTTPTTILFAIGVLLPLIIGAMLPMISLSGLDVSTIASQEGTTRSSFNLLHIILIMNVISPLGAFIYSFKILCNRPGTTAPPEIKNNIDLTRYKIVSTVLGGIFLLFIFLFSDFFQPIMPLPYFWPLVFSLSFYLLATTRGSKIRRDEIIEMEKEFPDALFQIGSRVAEGDPLEIAFPKAVKTMQGTSIGNLFGEISSSLQIKRLPLKETLFGEKGVLTDFPSKTITATMKTVIGLTSKDPKEAGKTILKISEYLREMEEMDHEIKSSLSRSVGMMKGTAMFFAPVVMGIVVSLYQMLYEIFMGISNIEMITPLNFTSVITIYLILMTFVIIYFTTGIRSQSDLLELKYQLGVSIPINMITFTAVLYIGKITILAV